MKNRGFHGNDMQLVPRQSNSQFKWPKKSLNALDALSAGRLIGAAADIALVLDSDGVIRDLALGSDDLVDEVADSWIGRPWLETVSSESRGKVEDLLAEAGSTSVTRWRHVNHPSPRGSDLPVRYCAIKFADDGRIVALGRDLRAMSALQQRLIEAQQALEREYQRLNQGEARYRLLFQMTPEAALVIDSASLRIVEFNPAAEALLSRRFRRIAGRAVSEIFARDHAEAAQDMLDTVRIAGRAEEISVKLAGSDDELMLAAYLFRQDNNPFFLLRLAAVGAQPDATIVPRAKLALLRGIETSPDAVVVIDEAARIQSVNDSFLALAEIASDERARTLRLDQLIGEPGVDFNVLIANLRQHGSVRNFATRLNGENGVIEDVEITATTIADVTGNLYMFTIRAAPRRSSVIATGATARSVEQLTELVGRVPLKELVRESTDIIERLCIEAALKLTGDNRASAADMLGLSRQSLYVKLRKYGLGDLDGE
jgi:transcriptional regulator PpsR